MAHWHDDLINGLKANNIRLICHVADSVLAPIIRKLEDDPAFRVVTLTREEEGVGLLTGAYLGGMRGVLLLQTSGFGNTLNALGSLSIPYQVPFPIIMSTRGRYLEHNVVQVAWGEAAPATAELLGLQVFPMEREDEAGFIAENAIKHAYVSRRPVVLTIETMLSGGKHASR